MRANQSHGSSPVVSSPTPREEPHATETPVPSKPVVDSETPVVAVDTKPSSERRPQRREGNLDAADVKVIHTTARDVRRRNREAREAEGKRLSQAGTTDAASRRFPSQKVNQAPERRTGIQEPRATAPGMSTAENGEQGSSSPKDSEKTPASAREIAEGARGSLARVVEYARTHVRLTIAVCVLVLAVVSLYGPVRDYYVAWRRQGALQAEYNELSNDHDNLQSDVDRLQSREGIEDEARRQGYGYSNEDTLNVEGVDDDPNQGSSPLDAQSKATEDVPWYVHVGDVIFFYSPDSQG